MKGCRAFTKDEQAKLDDHFTEMEKRRDLLIIRKGIKTGFRISELLSLQVDDVYRAGKIMDRVTVQRRHMKRQLQSRTVPLHHAVKEAIDYYLSTLPNLDPEGPLFLSQKGGGITPRQAWHILTTAADACQIYGNIGTHSMRKTFAVEAYEALGGDLVKLQAVMGHKNIDSTRRYLPQEEEEAWAILLSR